MSVFYSEVGTCEDFLGKHTNGMNVKIGCISCIKLRYSQGELSICSVQPYKDFQSGVLS